MFHNDVMYAVMRERAREMREAAREEREAVEARRTRERRDREALVTAAPWRPRHRHTAHAR
ncbi:hypothetical protein DZF91_19950 [Actinomadura logoneensis]|uniref:Uncharacterized protein n=1 Tax=Actinomadura logoneensis TaxID=2293572 RepID=A0A372JIT7_9ACTN|nr:hypothetical protein [Actinomadura logoneensis]RFU39880.1 hypothetical protein DZF91_19950 [Actinomadura logoneensis]